MTDTADKKDKEDKKDPLAKFPNLRKMQQDEGLIPPFKRSMDYISSYERRRMKFNGEEDPEIEERYNKLSGGFRENS